MNRAFTMTRRPRSLERFHGSTNIFGALSQMMATDDQRHLIFSGASGVGKTSTALWIASAVLCKADNDRPCLECSSCLSVERQSHQALHVINCAQEGGKEDIEFLLTEETRHEPVAARRHVIIFEEADQLSRPAQYALAVPLQETAGHRQFLFTCIDAEALIRPVRDRCRHFRFELPTHLQSMQYLREAADEEEIQVNDAALDLIAVFCRGYRSLLETLDAAASLACGSPIDPALLRRTVLRDRSAALLDYLAEVAGGNVERQLAILDECSLTAPEKVRAIREMLAHLRIRYTGRRTPR